MGGVSIGHGARLPSSVIGSDGTAAYALRLASVAQLDRAPDF